jgi:hypothetical protein
MNEGVGGIRVWPPQHWGPRLIGTFVALSIVLPALTHWLLPRGLGVLVLLTPLWAAFAPLLLRLHVSERGLHLRFALVESLLPLAQIQQASLEADPRRWVLGRREPVLRVVPRVGAPFLLLGRASALQALCAALQGQLARRPAAAAGSEHRRVP